MGGAWSALHWAASDGNATIVTQLIANGADINALHGVAGSCVHHCAAHDKSSAICVLAELSADVVGVEGKVNVVDVDGAPAAGGAEEVQPVAPSGDHEELLKVCPPLPSGIPHSCKGHACAGFDSAASARCFASSIATATGGSSATNLCTSPAR